jgi:hypothetical protein
MINFHVARARTREEWELMHQLRSLMAPIWSEFTERSFCRVFVDSPPKVGLIFFWFFLIRYLILIFFFFSLPFTPDCARSGYSHCLRTSKHCSVFIRACLSPCSFECSRWNRQLLTFVVNRLFAHSLCVVVCFRNTETRTRRVLTQAPS